MRIIRYILLFFVTLPLQAREHPYIYVTDSDRVNIKERIAHCEWAKAIYQRLRSSVDPYVVKVQQEPSWMVSRLAMYWKKGAHFTQCYLKDEHWDYGEGNAPVPTVRMPGMRTWNKYQNVPLAERIPYNETGDMWGFNPYDPKEGKVLVPYKKTGHMIRANNVEILTLAEKSAFLYWLTGEERYAAFSTDIFYTWLMGTYYMQPALDPGQASGGPGGYAPGGICGYYDYEQIHDDLAMHAAIIYDFMFDYLQRHSSQALTQTGKGLTEVAGIVFKRFIDIGRVRGGKSGNWNVNGWNMMLCPILALEDDSCYADRHGREYYLHFLVEESTPYHDAIPDILKGYDKVTGLWPESPGYSFGTIDMLLNFAVLLKRMNIDVIADNPVFQKAALAVIPWMDERGNMIAFGDYRGGKANFRTLENLIAYYTRTGDTDKIAYPASVLRTFQSKGIYDRGQGDWTSLFTYVRELPAAYVPQQPERTSYSPFHRIVTLKSQPSANNLMAVLYGGRHGSHLSENGLALQLYGYGYALAPDASAYESYWSDDYKYHQKATGSNTILPGYTHGDIRICNMEPMVDSLSFINKDALNPNLNMCEMEASEKRRLVALVKTDEEHGYYVDVFRSRQMDNDYLFHNVGSGMKLFDASGRTLEVTDLNELTPQYAEGYKWFGHLKAVNYDKAFRAVWTAPEAADTITMGMWMTGCRGRLLVKADAPYTTTIPYLTPGKASVAPRPTPTLLVRQSGCDGWSHPFVAVFQPARNQRFTIRELQTLYSKDGDILLKVCSDDKREDYVFSSASNRKGSKGFHKESGCFFNGDFGIMTIKDGNPTQLYLINGQKIGRHNCFIESESPVSASIYKQDGKWHYSSTGNIRIHLDKKVYVRTSGYNIQVQ